MKRRPFPQGSGGSWKKYPEIFFNLKVPEKTKRSSIVKKSILQLFLLGGVILGGVCIVASLMFYKKLINENTELAYSFVKIVTLQTSGSFVENIISEADSLSDILNSRHLTMTKAPETDSAYTEEQLTLAKEWTEVELFLAEAISFNTTLRDFQVVIPAQNEVICLWYASRENPSFIPMISRAYRPEEQETLESMTFGNPEETLTIYHEDGNMIGTAIYPIFNRNAEIVAYAELDVSITDIRTSIIRLIINIAVMLLLIMAVALYIDYTFLRKEIISPILKLKEAASNVVDKLKEDSTGPLHAHINTNDEIEDLSRSFEEMGQSLRSYIAENAAITAEKERINTELELASHIQSDMLPDTFPAFPDRKDFDIYASMLPAKEVGGDFYDFFLIDENTLALVIADVSGKGIPAALFMTKTMTMIENMAAKGLGPADILDSINKHLCANNESSMFVSVWLGILDLTGGILRASNAGHEYPIIQMPGKSFEIFKDKHSFIVGGMSDTVYSEYELTLLPGSKLFLYTDGLPEAENSEGIMFKLSRVLETLNRTNDTSPEALLQNMNQSIRDFVRDAGQSDDLTMLCLHYIGKNTEVL